MEEATAGTVEAERPKSWLEKVLTPIPCTRQIWHHRCAVPNCSRGSGRGSGSNERPSGFRIPLNMGVRKKWLDVCHFHDAIRDLKLPRICQDHFDVDEIQFKKGRRFLNKGAVPSRNLPDASNCAHCLKKRDGEDDAAAFLQQEVVPVRRTVFGTEEDEADPDDDWKWIPYSWPYGDRIVKFIPSFYWPTKGRRRKIKQNLDLRSTSLRSEVGMNVTANRRERPPAPEPRPPAVCPYFETLCPAKKKEHKTPAVIASDHDYHDKNQSSYDFLPQDDEDLLTPGRAKELFCKKLEEMKGKGVSEKDLDALFDIFIQSYKTCKRQEKQIRSNHFIVNRAKSGKLTKAMREELIEKHFSETHTQGQIEILKRGLKRPAKWTQEDLDLGRSIRRMAPKAYEMLRKNNKSFPLPSQKCIMEPAASESSKFGPVKIQKTKIKRKRPTVKSKSGRVTKKFHKKKSKLNEKDIQKLINSLTPAPIVHFQPQDDGIDEDETFHATSYIQSTPYVSNEVIRGHDGGGATTYHYTTIDNYTAYN